LVAPFCEQGQGVARWFGRRIGGGRHLACEGGKHASVDRIGLG
jgi:hypothetical protein